MNRHIPVTTFFVLGSLVSSATAEYPGWNNGNWNSNRPSWWGGQDDGSDSSSSSNSGPGASTLNQGALFSSEANFNKATRILIAHAVLASLVWVVFVPSLAILLRLNLKHPIILKIHAVGQVLSYLIYVAAAALGIWLAQQSAPYGIWEDPHPRLGLAILAIAFFQPIFGAVHHHIYKKRSQNLKSGKPTKPPGRTPIGRVHLWVGRILIALGIINGGLGIRLAADSPFQTEATSRKARIAYGTVAAVMFLAYLIFTIVFEVQRARSQLAEEAARERKSSAANTPPSYDESEESIERTSRYQ